MGFSRSELEAAQKAISSSIRKIEKAQETLSKKQPPPKAQLTLASRNLQALRLAVSLITRELENLVDNHSSYKPKEQGSGKMTNAPMCSKTADPGPFYHGTKAGLQAGDLLEPGYNSNFGARRRANFVYLTATLDAAVWGAELAAGGRPGRIYQVEPTGAIEDDPNLTDKKFPGNPTRSYRTRQPLRVVGEVLDWEGHPPEALQKMRDHLEELKRLGIEAIND